MSKKIGNCKQQDLAHKIFFKHKYCYRHWDLVYSSRDRAIRVISIKSACHKNPPALNKDYPLDKFHQLQSCALKLGCTVVMSFFTIVMSVASHSYHMVQGMWSLWLITEITVVSNSIMNDIHCLLLEMWLVIPRQSTTSGTLIGK